MTPRLNQKTLKMKKLKTSKRLDRSGIDLNQVRALDLLGQHECLDGQEEVFLKAFARLEDKWWNKLWPTFQTQHHCSRKAHDQIWQELTEIDARLHAIARLRSRLAPLPQRKSSPKELQRPPARLQDEAQKEGDPSPPQLRRNGADLAELQRRLARLNSSSNGETLAEAQTRLAALPTRESVERAVRRVQDGLDGRYHGLRDIGWDQDDPLLGVLVEAQAMITMLFDRWRMPPLRRRRTAE